MASNVTNQSRNVLSKKFMVEKVKKLNSLSSRETKIVYLETSNRNLLMFPLKQEALDNINLFSVITIISFVLLVPVAILIDGFKFTPSQLQIAVSEHT